jgi:hypothetical protein
MMESKTKGMVVLYTAASSMMLVLNKGAITLIPAPGLLLALQLAATVLLALGAWTRSCDRNPNCGDRLRCRQ